MKKRDVIDLDSVKRFAWGLNGAEESPKLTDVKARVEVSQSDRDIESEEVSEDLEGLGDFNDVGTGESADEPSFSEEASRACQPIIQLANELWTMPHGDARLAEIKRLAELASEAGILLFGLLDDPRAAVRACRMIVAEFDKLPSKLQHTTAIGLSCLQLEHPEILELVVETAIAGHEQLAFMTKQAVSLEEIAPDRPDISRRMMELLLDPKQSWRCRIVAADWLALSDSEDAIVTFRTALRFPNPYIRATALEVLLEHSPPKIEVSDVSFLLDDAVEHPLVEYPFSDRTGTLAKYESQIIDALRVVTPAEGFRALEAILSGHCKSSGKRRRGLDRAWALLALAAGYPARAEFWIDHALAEHSSNGRVLGLRAAALLPEDAARVRLAAAMTDSNYDVAEQARSLWFDRFKTEFRSVTCEDLGFPDASPVVESRLGVLRGESAEAVFKMKQALLEAAPDPEALALLTYSLTGGHPWSDSQRKGFPNSFGDWAKTLILQFDEPGIEAVFSLAERETNTEQYDSWLLTISELISEGGSIPERYEARARQIAIQRLISPTWWGGVHGLNALAVVGLAPEIVDRIWTLATEDSWHATQEINFPPTWVDNIRDHAVKVLKTESGKVIDPRVVVRAEQAWASREWALLARLIEIGVAHKEPTMIRMAKQCLKVLTDEDTFDLRDQSVRSLLAVKKLPRMWIEKTLSDFDSPQFAVALAQFGSRGSPVIRRRLRRAVVLAESHPAAAADAAGALLTQKFLSPRDPQLKKIFHKAPPDPRERLAQSIAYHGAPLALIRSYYQELAQSQDPAIVQRVLHALTAGMPRTNELLEEILELPNISDELRDGIAVRLRKPTLLDRYWLQGQDAVVEKKKGSR